MEELLRLLREFAAADVERQVSDEDLQALIGRAEAFGAEGDDAGPTAMSDDDLDALVSGLQGLADEDLASAALLREAHATFEAASGEVTRREDEAAAEEAERQAAIAALRGENEEGEEEIEGPAEEEAPEEPEEPEAAAEEVEEPEPEPVTAAQPNRAVRRASRKGLARRRPADAAPVEASMGPRISFKADVPNRGVGSSGTLADVNQAMMERWRAYRGNRSTGSAQKIAIATILRDVPEARSLSDGSGRMLAPHQASERVQAALNEALAAYRTEGTKSLTAAGGLCAPLQPIYDVPMIGEQSRPIRDGALMSFQASRGGVVSVTPPTLAQINAQSPNSVDVWTTANDVSAAEEPPGDTKSCARIVCNDQVETEIHAITKCIIIGNLIARTFNEYVDTWGETVMVHQDRVAEQVLFDQITGLDLTGNGFSTPAITTQHSLETTVLSATRDLLTFLDQVAWNLRTRHRLGRNFPFRVILPEIVHGVFRTDIARALPGGSFVENLNLADATIASFFASRNLLVTWSPDLVVQAAPTGGAEFPDWPSDVPYALYPEGTFLHLDAGELDLGVVRDSTLNDTNDYEVFAETFEAAHPLGVEAVAGNVQVCPVGMTSGTVDLSGLCPAS